MMEDAPEDVHTPVVITEPVATVSCPSTLRELRVVIETAVMVRALTLRVEVPVTTPKVMLLPPITVNRLVTTALPNEIELNIQRKSNTRVFIRRWHTRQW
jgi:hypothetical protein